ncbi:MAG: 50S ribosomal protein L16 [Candidatus Diapherotrites archaeon]
MGLRPGHCYRYATKPSYTRMAVKVHSKNYIGATPGLKTRRFNMGNPLKEFDTIVDWISEEDRQFRDNALESARQGIVGFLNKKIGKENFFLKIRVYPFQILRENKQAQGAGADRVTKGMSHPFGKPIGRAARVRQGKVLMSLLVDEENTENAKIAFKHIVKKVGMKTSVRVHKDVQSIGTKPKKVREEVVEVAAPTAEETAAAEAAAATPEAGKTGGKETGKAPVKEEKPAAKGKK